MHNCQPLHHLLQHISSKLCHLYSFSNHSLLRKISSFGQNSRLYRNFLYLYNCQPLHHLLQLTSFRNFSLPPSLAYHFAIIIGYWNSASWLIIDPTFACATTFTAINCLRTWNLRIVLSLALVQLASEQSNSTFNLTLSLSKVRSFIQLLYVSLNLKLSRQHSISCERILLLCKLFPWKLLF